MAKALSDSSEMSLRDFIDAVGSAEQGHGVVSAAAVAGALGSSLLRMVTTLPQTRSDATDDRTKLIEASTALSDVQEQLIETIETETAVKLFAARNLPQASDAQRSQRQAAIQVALRASAEVPLEVMRLCARGLQLAATVAAHGARATSGDVQLGIVLLQAGFNGGRSNLERKMSTLTDTAYVRSVIDEIARLSDETTVAAHAAETFLQVPPA